MIKPELNYVCCGHCVELKRECTQFNKEEGHALPCIKCQVWQGTPVR